MKRIEISERYGIGLILLDLCRFPPSQQKTGI